MQISIMWLASFQVRSAKPEAVEDLKAAALQTIGLAAEDLGVPLVYDAGLDAAGGPSRWRP